MGSRFSSTALARLDVSKDLVRDSSTSGSSPGVAEKRCAGPSVAPNVAYIPSPEQGGTCTHQTKEKEMRQPPRHVEDTVTSVLALLVSSALGIFVLLVLMLALALGF